MMLPLGEGAALPPVAVGVVALPDGYDGPVVWEVNDEYPVGRARPMTDDEISQRDADQKAAAVLAAEPQPPTLADRIQDVVDAVLNAADFDTAKAALRKVADLS